jgi:DNA-binding NarL/FixJ family response regulator
MELSKEARKLRSEYQRKWKQEHPDKVKQYFINYWEKKAGNVPIIQQVKKLSEQGLTQREISTELDISLGAVNKYLHK